MENKETKEELMGIIKNLNYSGDTLKFNQMEAFAKMSHFVLNICACLPVESIVLVYAKKDTKLCFTFYLPEGWKAENLVDKLLELSKLVVTPKYFGENIMPLIMPIHILESSKDFDYWVSPDVIQQLRNEPTIIIQE